MNTQIGQAQQKMFHPSMFETVSSDTPSEVRTLLTIREERDKRLPSDEIKNLKSPGRYLLSDEDRKISTSNTRYLFKNLYGETLLTYLFFSDRNVKNIQNLIKYLVNKETGYTVDDQSTNELLVIMRALFLEYSAHPPLIDEKMSDARKLELYKKYTTEVSRLNQIVVNAIVPKVVSQMQQYLDYLRDISRQPEQMERPKSDSVAGQRQYRSVTQLLTGGDL